MLLKLFKLWFWRGFEELLILIYSRNSFTISIFLELGIFWIFPIVVDSSVASSFFSPILLAFTKPYIKPKVYEPVYIMGPMGFEPSGRVVPVRFNLMYIYKQFYKII